MKKYFYLNVVVLVMLIIAIGLSLPVIAKAASYPRKPIVWIIPVGPGGTFDLFARVLSQYLPKYLPNKVNVVVKNMPGAGGLNGAGHLFRAKPDGYTIGYIMYPGITVLAMESNIGFDPDLSVPIAQISADPQAIFVSAKSNLKTLADLQAKDPLRIVTIAKGVTMYSFSVITGEAFNLKYKMVTGYSGGASVATGLMRGDGDMAVLMLNNYYRFVKSGDLRVVVTLTDKRHPLTPDIPSATELGGSLSTVCKSWKVVFAPPGLPDKLTKIIRNAFNQALNDPKFLAWSVKANKPISYLDGPAAWKGLQDVFPVYKKYR
ncbi:tripartite tricarboxylate transporter substrate binding protein [Thermodesulfobacteriota bacterium]